MSLARLHKARQQLIIAREETVGNDELRAAYARAADEIAVLINDIDEGHYENN